MTFLFWNIMKQDLREVVARAVSEHSVDVLMLAECGTPRGVILQELKERVRHDYYEITSSEDRVQIWTTLKPNKWARLAELGVGGRLVIWRLDVGLHPGILLGTAHLRSKLHSKDTDQIIHAMELAHEIRRLEQREANDRTVLVGDFNMNPFEEGMIRVQAFHAVRTTDLAREKQERTVQGNKYPAFFNPMWYFMRQDENHPPGTFFHHSPNESDVYWHLFDQVILRPSLIACLTDLRLLNAIESDTILTKQGLPNKTEYSDHLPLIFRLNLS